MLRVFEYDPLIDSSKVMEEARAFIDYMRRVSNDFEEPKNVKSNKRITLQTLFDRDRAYLQQNLPAITQLMEICLLLAMSNAKVEGSFSTMNLIHDHSRNCLKVTTVNALMFVKSYSCTFEQLKKTPSAIREILSIWQGLPAWERYGSDKKGKRDDDSHLSQIQREFKRARVLSQKTKGPEDNKTVNSKSNDETITKISFKGLSVELVKPPFSKKEVVDADSGPDKRPSYVPSTDMEITVHKESVQGTLSDDNHVKWILTKAPDGMSFPHIVPLDDLTRLGTQRVVNARALKSLQNGTYLNDEALDAIAFVIRNAYILHANEKRNVILKKTVLVSTTQFYTRLLNRNPDTGSEHYDYKGMETYDCAYFDTLKQNDALEWFLPIHLPGHWILAYIDFRNKVGEVFDSWNNTPRPVVIAHLKLLIEHIFATHAGRDHKEYHANTLKDDAEWTFFDRNVTEPLTPQQQDGYNCGIFVLWFIYCKLSKGLNVRPMTITPQVLRKEFAKALVNRQLTFLPF